MSMSAKKRSGSAACSTVAICVVVALLAVPTEAETLRGCVSKDGHLNNLVVDNGQITEQCPQPDDIPVKLGVGGVTEIVAATVSRTLGRGGQSFCFPPDESSVGGVRGGWALILSDENILPTAYFNGGQRDLKGYQIETYPIDCDDDTGYEFVCQFATP